MDELSAKIQQWWVEPGYHDIFGQWRQVPEASLRAVVAALSGGLESPADVDGQIAEQQAYQGDRQKVWALAVQLYSVRSDRNWGIGDFGDLQTAVGVAAEVGASAVGINPLHALFLDQPERASPYAPNSRLFLNPLYIAVDQVPDLESNAEFEREAQSCRAPALVDYARVAALKMQALRTAYDHFRRRASPERRNNFDAFRSERGESLLKFSCFEVLRTLYPHRSWRQWPEPLAEANPAALAEVRKDKEDACTFIEYLQWLANQQLLRCQELATRKGMSIGLYLDLAVGVDPNGADAWANQSAIVPELSVGAPSDEFNPAGQNWGLAPFNPHLLPRDDFRLMRELLASTMRYAGAIRLDHILGLKRLYVIPQGMTGRDGAYIRFPFEALLRIVAEESNKHRCIVVGEDLGTVPEGFTQTVARWGIWTYKVVLFERWSDGRFKGPEHYPAAALATFNTHDLPTFRGWISGADLAAKRAIDVDPGESDEARAAVRAALQQMLGRFAGSETDRFAAVAVFLASAPSRLVSVSIEDLLEVAEQVNVPGTVNQYPNWRRKLPVPVEDWRSQPTFNAVCAAFDAAGRSKR